jgi:hypothetical protein
MILRRDARPASSWARALARRIGGKNECLYPITQTNLSTNVSPGSPGPSHPSTDTLTNRPPSCTSPPCASLLPESKRQQDIRPVTKPTWKNCGSQFHLLITKIKTEMLALAAVCRSCQGTSALLTSLFNNVKPLTSSFRLQ